MLKIVDKGVVYEKSTGLIASICKCENNDLLSSVNSGGDLSAGQKTMIVRSKNNSKTWSEPETTFESVFKHGGIKTGCSIASLSSGRIILSYADGFYMYPGTDNYDRHALLFCPISDDNGKTWINTKAQSYEGIEAFPFGKIIELKDKTLLLPIWGSYLIQGDWFCGVLKSTDYGENWGDYSQIAKHGDETPIILLPDGRVMALLRGYTNLPERPFHISYSEDNGKTWGEPIRINVNGTSPSLHITPKGKLLAGYRSTLEGANCHIASSDDLGLTWKFEIELELPKGKWYYGGYPNFENLPDGRIISVFHNADPTWYVGYNIIEEN